MTHGNPLLFAGCLAANYAQAALERQRVTRTFQRYVAPEIVSELMGSGPDSLKVGVENTIRNAVIAFLGLLLFR